MNMIAFIPTGECGAFGGLVVGLGLTKLTLFS
jgi:hypothetical protein